MGGVDFSPTFTQGFVVGQISILILLAFILRYLFLDAGPNSPELEPPVAKVVSSSETHTAEDTHANAESGDEDSIADSGETLDWLNLILQGLARAYRSDIRSNLTGSAGNEAARRRIEGWLQASLATPSLTPVKVHSVKLGKSAPELSNARIRKASASGTEGIEVDIHYSDNIVISLSTSFLFNFPSAEFARLPISLSISLSHFRGTVTIFPPSAASPALSLSLLPGFDLQLAQSSLMGSRAKLADVPKVHQLLQNMIKATISKKLGEYKILLPGIQVGEDADLMSGFSMKTLDVAVENS